MSNARWNAVCLLLLAQASCQTAADPRVSVEVFAASSLVDAFGDLEAAFEAANPDVDIRLTFAGSQLLRLQISQGATVDVFASADQTHMDALGDAGLVEPSAVFARNELVLIVPLQNAAGLRTLADLPRARRIVLGDAQVPAGRYADDLIARAGARLGPGFSDGVSERVVSRELNVRLVRSKVELGEADAAIVYRTDVTDRVATITIPDDLGPIAEYPIARTAAAPSPQEAGRFTEFVRSPAGQAVLAEHGFLSAEP